MCSRGAQCRSDSRCEMWLLILLLFRVTAASVFKCCESDASLVLVNDVPTCANATTPLSAHGDVVIYGFPESCNATIVTPPESSYCVDKVGDDVIGLGCENETYLEPPSIFTIRKCCYNGWYDPQKRICLNTTDDTYFPEDLLVRNRTCFINVVHGIEQCSPGKVVVDIVVSVEDIYLLDNGSLILNATLLETYCLDSAADGEIVVKACLDAEKECSRRSCVQKCCPDGFGMILSRSCEPSKFDFKPQFHSLFEPVNDVVPSFGILSNFSCKNEKFVLLPEYSDDDRNYLQVGGTLYVPAYKNFSNLTRDDYCLERVLSPDNGMDSIYAFLCFPDDEPEELSLQFLLLSLGLIISSVFLLLTFLVYACLPSLRNLHGKTLMCHVASLFAAYVCLSMGQLGTYSFSYGLCATIGYCILFTFLASFSWLNVMCFDIWWTFGAVRSLRQGSGSRKHREQRRFFYYSIYAWGVPSALTALTILMDVVADLSPLELKPNMGLDHCWFSNQSHGIVVYFLGPVSPMVISNMVFFVLTARSCSKVKAEIHRMQKNSIGDRCKKRYQANRTKLVMNGKLFVVMGVTWALEIVSSQVKDPPWIWYLSDAANALQGALIFCIFVMKRKVLQTLAHRFGLRIRAYTRPNTAEHLTCYDPYRVRKTSSNLTINTTLTDSRSTRFSTNSNR